MPNYQLELVFDYINEKGQLRKWTVPGEMSMSTAINVLIEENHGKIEFKGVATLERTKKGIKLFHL
jgi:hypothetical protein